MINWISENPREAVIAIALLATWLVAVLVGGVDPAERGNMAPLV